MHLSSLLLLVLRAAIFHLYTLEKNKFFHLLFTCVFGEADAQWRLLDLLCKQILFVEEEDDGSVDEELVVADGVEQHQRLMHAILWRRKSGTER